MEGETSALYRALLYFAVLAAAGFDTVCSADACQGHEPPPLVTVSETQLPGYVVLEFERHYKDIWTYSIEAKSTDGLHYDLTPYLDLVHSLHGYNELMLQRSLDLERIYAEAVNNNPKQAVEPDFNGTLSVTFFCSSKDNAQKNLSNHTSTIVISPVNEFCPEFKKEFIYADMFENATLGTTVLRLRDWSFDRDRLQGELKFHVKAQEVTMKYKDGWDWFSAFTDVFKITDPDGDVILDKLPVWDSNETDFTRVNFLVTVEDQGRLTSIDSKVEVKVLRSNYVPPYIAYHGCTQPCPIVFTATVDPDFTGRLWNIHPQSVSARHKTNYVAGMPLVWDIIDGPAGFTSYIHVYRYTGDRMKLKIKKPLGDWKETCGKNLNLTIQLTEENVYSFRQRATLIIRVNRNPEDKSASRGEEDDKPCIDWALFCLTSVLSFVFGCSIIALGSLLGEYKQRIDDKIVTVGQLASAPS